MINKDEKINEIAEALKKADNKLLASVYTLVMLTTEFSEQKIDLEKAEEEKKEKPATPAKKTKAAKPANKPAEMDMEDFDEDLTEDQPVLDTPSKEVKVETVQEDFDFEDEPVTAEEPKVEQPKQEVKPTKEVKQEKSNDFDDDFDFDDF